MLPQLYQTVLTNFGNTVYIGESQEDAITAAINSGFESVVMLDGKLVSSYSPISGAVQYA